MAETEICGHYKEWGDDPATVINSVECRWLNYHSVVCGKEESHLLNQKCPWYGFGGKDVLYLAKESKKYDRFSC